jgi:nucleotidyltransferase/DNA polymerase involved in DNA repair
MHYIASLSIPHFYLLPYAQDAQRSAHPLLISCEKHIIDANEAAVLAGFRVGMGLQEAKCMAESSSWIVAFEEERYRSLRTQMLELCAEFTDRIEPAEFHRVYLDFLGHSKPGEIAWETAKRVAHQFQSDVMIGYAQAKWLARLAESALPASTNLDLPQRDFPTDLSHTDSFANPARFLAAQRVSKLAPVNPQIRQRLQFLGYPLIGDVQKIPYRTLKSQFRDEADIISTSANGTYDDPVVPRFQITRISGRIDMDDASSWLDIEPGLRKLAKRLSTRLKKLDSVIRTVQLTVTFSSGICKEAARTFSKPLQSTLDLLRAMVVLFPECKEPLETVHISLPDLERMKQKQRQLDGSNDRGERKISAEAAFRSVKTSYGDSAIKVASEVSLPRRKLVLRAWQSANGWH